MGLKRGAKVFVCADEVEVEAVFAFNDETWMTGGGEEVEEEREMGEVAEMGFQWRVELERSMALIGLWCAVELRLEV